MSAWGDDGAQPEKSLEGPDQLTGDMLSAEMHRGLGDGPTAGGGK